MFAHERHQRIQQLLATHGRLTFAELQQELPASPATVRRDLTELERAGALVRTHGGILHPATLQGEPVFHQRATVAADAKRAIAERAAADIPAKGMVFLDTGTTVLALAGLLIPRKDLVIATNSLPVLSLARSDGAHVIALGGDVRIPSQSLCGAAALEWVGRLHFDLAVMGASGLDPKDGASITSLEECAMKQGAMERADRVLLLADRGKWRHPAGIVFAPWDRFDCWVTDAQLDVGDAAGLAAPRLRVVKV